MTPFDRPNSKCLQTIIYPLPRVTADIFDTIGLEHRCFVSVSSSGTLMIVWSIGAIQSSNMLRFLVLSRRRCNLTHELRSTSGRSTGKGSSSELRFPLKDNPESVVDS